MPSERDFARLVALEVDRVLRQRRRRTIKVGVSVFLLGVLLMEARALAQTMCSQTLPFPLVTFCANTPALASDINNNFNALASAVVARTGPLDGGTGLTVTAPGKLMFTDGQDFVLDSQARRAGATGIRRALVHDASDTLTMNYSGDYSGGTKIGSRLEVTGSITASGNVTVAGAIASGCPTTYPIGGQPVTMVDMGAYCIMYNSPAGLTRNTVSWLEANQFCVSKGLRMCGMAEVSAAATLGRIETYSISTGDYWAFVDQTGSDNQAVGLGVCFVKLNPDHGAFALGEANCAHNWTSRHPSIEGLCCL